MAGPCIISFKGKDYSYEEFAAMLHDGLLADLVADKIISGIDVDQLSKGGRGEYKPRSFTKRFLKEFPDLEGALSEGAINYALLPNSTTLEEANIAIDWLGEYEAAKAYKDLENGMTWAVRNTIGQVLIKRFREAGDLDKVIELNEELTRRATELGQGIQALAMFNALTPEGALRDAEKIIQTKRDKYTKAKSEVAKTVVDELNKINKEAVGKVVEKLKGKLEETQKIKPNKTEKTPSYGQNNKIVSKARYDKLLEQVKGKFFSNLPPELFEIAAFHLEASSRQFAGFAKKMVRDLGDKVKPYLQTLYNSAKKDLSKQYNDFEDQAIVDAELSKILGKEFKKTLKAEGVDIKDVIETHYTKYERIKTSLTEKFIKDLGLSENEAKDLSKLIEAEFDRMTSEKKKQVIDKLFTPKERIAKRKQKRSLEEEIYRLSNLGVFSKEELLDKFGEKMGWPPKLKPAQVKEIEALAKKVQDAPEGLKRFKAIEDLYAYQENLKGISLFDLAMAGYYARMLSGPLTHLANLSGNVGQAIGEYIVSVARSPKSGKALAQAYLEAFPRAFLEAKSTWQTGYAPIKGKVEAPNILERYTFAGGKYNPANYMKYVGRALLAGDVLFYVPAKNMRIYNLAISLSKDGDIEPSESAKKRAAHILNINNDTVDMAMAQANIEYEEEVAAIKASDASESEKKNQIKIAKLDEKRRVYELIEKEADPDIIEEGNRFGAFTTFNHPPYGLLGGTAKLINMTTNQFKALKPIVPFTNIIANVMNEKINYTPWGFARAALGKGLTFSGRFNENLQRNDWNKLTESQKRDAKIRLYYKAMLGTSLMTALLILSNIGDDDDKDPLFEITANGSNNYAENQYLKSKGWQEYSIKIGDTWISYKEWSIFLPLVIVGTINDYSKYNKKSLEDPEVQTKLLMTANQIKDVIVNSTAIAGMNTFAKIALESSGERLSTKLKAAFANTAKTYVVPAIYTQVAREIEKKFNIPTKEVKGTWLGPMLMDLPIARDLYYNKVNIFGREVIPNTDRFFSTEVDDALIDLFVKNKYYPTVPSVTTETIIDDETQEQRLMTRQEFYEYAKRRGTALREMMEDLYDDLNDLDPADFEATMASIVESVNISAKPEND